MVYLDPKDPHTRMMLGPGRIVLLWKQEEIGHIRIEKKKDGARVLAGKVRDKELFGLYAQQLLVIALNQLKKEGIWKTRVLGRLRKSARELGYGQKWLDLKGVLVRVLRKEKPVARYAGKDALYELIVKKQRKEYCSMFTENGIPIAYVKWRIGKEIGHIDRVRSGLENKRMTKTLLLYTLWKMKQEGMKKASLVFMPESGKEKQAEGLYRSIGFKHQLYSLEWVFDLEKTRLQKMYLK